MGGNSVHLNWNDNTIGESGYLIQRYTRSGWRNAKTVAANATAAVIDGLPTGSSTSYRVVAIGIQLPTPPGQRTVSSLSGVSAASTNTVSVTTATIPTDGWYKVSITGGMQPYEAAWEKHDDSDALAVLPQYQDQWLYAGSWQAAVWTAVNGHATVYVTDHQAGHSPGDPVTHNFPSGGDFKVGTGAYLADTSQSGAVGFKLPHTGSDADTKYIALEDSYGDIDRDYDDFYWIVSADKFEPKVDISGPDELWYFGGENAANYDESGGYSYTADAPENTFTTATWTLVGKTDAADLSSQGGTSGDSITVDSNVGTLPPPITLTSTGASSGKNDLQVQVFLGGVLAGIKSVTVKVAKVQLANHAPYPYRDLLPPEFAPKNGNGFKTLTGLEVTDQFGTPVPQPMEINESFGTVTDILTNNWPQPQGNHITTFQPNYSWATTPSYFQDIYGLQDDAGTTYSPLPVLPNTTTASTLVQKFVQYYNAGSLTVGKGWRASEHTVDIYKGYGRWE